jgi:hypothetical protein
LSTSGFSDDASIWPSHCRNKWSVCRLKGSERCPRNADKTYDLIEFFQWFNRWQQNKAPAGRQAFQVRKAIRETYRELLGTSVDAQDIAKKIKTALQ